MLPCPPGNTPGPSQCHSGHPRAECPEITAVLTLCPARLMQFPEHSCTFHVCPFVLSACSSCESSPSLPGDPWGHSSIVGDVLPAPSRPGRVLSSPAPLQPLSAPRKQVLWVAPHAVCREGSPRWDQQQLLVLTDRVTPAPFVTLCPARARLAEGRTANVTTVRLSPCPFFRCTCPAAQRRPSFPCYRRGSERSLSSVVTWHPCRALSPSPRERPPFLHAGG